MAKRRKHHLRMIASNHGRPQKAPPQKRAHHAETSTLSAKDDNESVLRRYKFLMEESNGVSAPNLSELTQADKVRRGFEAYLIMNMDD
jgi:hypothetical protein